MEFEDAPGLEARILKSLFQQECLRRGVLFTASHNVCASHSAKDIDETLRVYRTALEILRDALAAGTVNEMLVGDPVSPVMDR